MSVYGICKYRIAWYALSKSISTSSRFTTCEIDRLCCRSCSCGVQFHCTIRRSTGRARTCIIMCMRRWCKGTRSARYISPSNTVCRFRNIYGIGGKCKLFPSTPFTGIIYSNINFSVLCDKSLISIPGCISSNKKFECRISYWSIFTGVATTSKINLTFCR